MGQYLQNITKRLDMGAEIFYQRGAQVPGNQIGIYTLAGRYKSMSCFSENYPLQVGTHCTGPHELKKIRTKLFSIAMSVARRYLH